GVSWRALGIRVHGWIVRDRGFRCMPSSVSESAETQPDGSIARCRITPNAIVRKCTAFQRPLLEFFWRGDRMIGRDDMVAADFDAFATFEFEPAQLKNLEGFRKRVNKWTVHLAWSRTTDPDFSKADRE